MVDVDHEAIFRSSPLPSLVLDLDLRIVDANAAYLRATHRELAELAGRGIFDAFPANPRAAEGDEGATRLSTSLARVLDSQQPHHMWVQRYDVPWPGAPTGFVERHWSVTNAPIVGPDGAMLGVLHVVEDVTGLRDDLVAALDFYREEIGVEGDTEERRARRFTAYAKVAMSSARQYEDVAREVEQLRKALTSRATIDQAKGIVMATRACGPEEAFEALVGLSKSRNVKLRDLAARIVAAAGRGAASELL